MSLTKYNGNDDCFYTDEHYLFHEFYYGHCNQVMTRIRRAIILASSGTYNHISCHDIEEICYCINNPESYSRVKKHNKPNRDVDNSVNFTDLCKKKLIKYDYMF